MEGKLCAIWSAGQSNSSTFKKPLLLLLSKNHRWLNHMTWLYSFQLWLGNALSFVSVLPKMDTFRPWKGVKPCANVIAPAKMCKRFVQNTGWCQGRQISLARLIYRLTEDSGTAIVRTNEYNEGNDEGQWRKRWRTMKETIFSPQNIFSFFLLVLNITEVRWDLLRCLLYG